MNVITLKNRHFEQSNKTRQSMSLFMFFIIVFLIFFSSIAYGEEEKNIGQIVVGFFSKKEEEQPIDFLLRKINEKNNYSDDNKVNLPDPLKERLKKEFQNKFPNKLDDYGKRRIEADIKRNPWYYFFCSDEKRNDFFAIFKINSQSKKEIIDRRKNLYNDFEAVKSFVEKIKKINTEPKGKGILISEVFWLKDAFDIPNKFLGINEISSTKEKYEPWNRNIPFFFDNDLEILNRTKKAKGKIQKILNEKLMKRLEKIEELEKNMKGEFPETKDSFSVLKEIKNVIKEAPIK